MSIRENRQSWTYTCDYAPEHQETTEERYPPSGWLTLRRDSKAAREVMHMCPICTSTILGFTRKTAPVQPKE